jgi:diaminopimelate decarboxylase
MFTCPNVKNEELSFLLDSGVKLNLDSLSELRRLLKLGLPDFISVRVNPGIGAGCHPYDVLGGESSKFGLCGEKALEAYKLAKRSGIKRFGIHMHIGSGILSSKPFLEAGRKFLEVARETNLEGIELEQLDFGGGIGIPYKPEENELDIENFSAKLLGLFKRKVAEYELGSPTFAMEPGRYIVGNAAVLLTRVNTIKNTPSKRFVGVDAGFNTLIRPALYRAYHHIVVEKSRQSGQSKSSERYDVVGPLCEASDFLALDRELPRIEEGDLLVVKDVGAYGFSMSSPYLSRPRAAEVLVKGDQYGVVRERERPTDLLRHQRIARWLQ